MAYIDFFGKTLGEGGYMLNTFSATAAINMVVRGTARNDGFLLGTGAYTIHGGAGDDRYYQVTQAYRIVELANDGIDTVYVVNNYVMPDHIENLVVGYAPGVRGNEMGNIMVGNASFQSIEGAAGNDVLTGGGGGDTFQFGAGSGYDVITDFRPGASTVRFGAPDTVRLSGYTQFDSFDDVQGAMSQVGNDVVLTLSSTDAIKFSGTRLSAFTADNFLLAFDPSQLTLTFSDEFDSLSIWDGRQDGVWRTDYGWGNDRNAPIARTLASNGEQQLYVDKDMIGKNGAHIDIEPFSIDDGILTIHADLTDASDMAALYGYKFSSGLLTTRNSFTQTYGYFEARMELPQVKGAWPAFWLYTTGSSGSELDVMESHGTDSSTVAVHDYSSGANEPQTGYIFQPDLGAGFHTYGVLWTAETVTWYMDGVAVKSIATPADMHGPMYLLLNLAIDGAAKTGDFVGGADMRVDYVRAYGLDDLPEGLAKGGAASVAKHWDHVGTAGNDTFIIITSGDRITEQANQGVDTVQARADYVLPTNVEHLILQDLARSGTGNALANRIEGNALDNILIGVDGNDTLAGNYGADRMIGGTGNDSYIVENVGDLVVELAGEGTDTVHASVDYKLSAHVETLILNGTAIRGSGNDLANTIIGNALANRLEGGAGNDTLDGGIGADTMSGGLGDDRYTVDNRSDVIIEAAGQGSDSVFASADYMLPMHVETLLLTGTAVRGTSNAMGGAIYGNAVDNILTGGAARDWLEGNAGNDIIYGMGGHDRLVGGLGNDFLRGNEGDDVLDGGFGVDTLQGGTGRDIFAFGDLAHTGTTFATADKVQDLNRAEGDRIDLYAIDANSRVAGNQAFTWIGTGAFSGAAGELRDVVSGTNHMVQGDINGDRIADFMLVVNTAGNLPLAAVDFLL